MLNTRKYQVLYQVSPSSDILFSFRGTRFPRRMPPTPTFVRRVSLNDEKRPGRCIEVRYFRNVQDSGKAAAKPTVVYVPGFMSHGKVSKAERLSEVCARKGFNFVSYDPEGEPDLSKYKFYS